jgi:CRP-like cAMP-binding protein
VIIFSKFSKLCNLYVHTNQDPFLLHALSSSCLISYVFTSNQTFIQTHFSNRRRDCSAHYCFQSKAPEEERVFTSSRGISRQETFVTRGCLRAYYVNDKGEEHIAQFAVEDWWIGDMYSFLTDTPSTLSIEALEECELLQIDRPGLEDLYVKLPKMERFFRIIIQNAFIAAQKRVISSMSKTADERYLDFIKKYPNIEQRIPQYQVAAYLGVTPEFLSRIRKKFARQIIS